MRQDTREKLDPQGILALYDEEVPLGTATYSVQDNKLRLYLDGRQPEDLYQVLTWPGHLGGYGMTRPGTHGFYGRVWRPELEDLALRLCGDIEDETMTSEERAEMKAERITGYSSNAARRSSEAQQRSHDLTKGIPMGQPILAGHHSEKGHRNTLKKARNAMDRAVDELKKADYWAYRGRGVERNAAHLAAHGTIRRRIAKLEKAIRKHTKNIGDKNKVRFYLDGYSWAKKRDRTDREMDEDWSALEVWNKRFLLNLENQLAYWKATLPDDEKREWPVEKGGWVKRHHVWRGPIKRTNKGGGGSIISVSLPPYPGRGWHPNVVKLLDVTDYRSPADWEALGEEGQAALLYEARAEEFAASKRILLPEARKKLQEEILAMEQTKAALDKVEVVSVWSRNFVTTPDNTADDMVRLLELPDRPGIILEPSMGSGQLLRAVWRVNLKVEFHVCELNYDACRVTLDKYQPKIVLVETDFLDLAALRDNGRRRAYSRIIMNPPWIKRKGHGWEDIAHVLHAWELLAPRGILVALINAATNTHADKQSEHFRSFVEEHSDAGFIATDEEMFKPQGVSAQGVIVRLRKD